MRKLATLIVALFVSSSAFAATPSEGVPLQVRRGFFTETDIGGFFTLGGYDGYSNLQIYLQLGIGYQFTINDGAGIIPIGLHVGIGSNAQNCWATQRTASGACQIGSGSNATVFADNFTMTMINLSAGYLHRVVERFYVGGKLLGGVTLIDPRPIPDDQDITNQSTLIAPNFGVALSVEYATNMDHFSIGLDVAYRFAIGPNISELMFYPRVQYTF